MAKQIVSRFTQQDGKWYLEVDGEPFLYQCIQSWYLEDSDFEQYVRAAAAMEYPVFAYWVCWRDMEPSPGVYDFRCIDEVIRLAEKYDIRLDYIWGGSDFCDHLDPRFAPEWVCSQHEWHVHEPDGTCRVADGFDMGPCCVAEPKNEALFEAEYRVLAAMLSHLEKADPTHRVICIQLENEINIHGYSADKASVLAYINRMAQRLETLDYQIALRVNIAMWQFDRMDEEIDALPAILAQGIDTYSWDVQVTRRMLTDGNATKFRYIAENGAYENSTAHIVAALACGGFYNIYRLDYDAIWDRPGAYGAGWKVLPVTLRITELNRAMNAAPIVIAKAPPVRMVEYNTESSGMPDLGYYAEKTLNGRRIGFEPRNSAAVALIVEEDGWYYVFGDGDGSLYLTETPVEAATGRFDRGCWSSSADALIGQKILDNGKIYLPYASGTCLRIRWKTADKE